MSPGARREEQQPVDRTGGGRASSERGSQVHPIMIARASLFGTGREVVVNVNPDAQR